MDNDTVRLKELYDLLAIVNKEIEDKILERAHIAEVIMEIKFRSIVPDKETTSKLYRGPRYKKT